MSPLFGSTRTSFGARLRAPLRDLLGDFERELLDELPVAAELQNGLLAAVRHVEKPVVEADPEEVEELPGLLPLLPEELDHLAGGGVQHINLAGVVAAGVEHVAARVERDVVPFPELELAVLVALGLRPDLCGRARCHDELDLLLLRRRLFLLFDGDGQLLRIGGLLEGAVERGDDVVVGLAGLDRGVDRLALGARDHQRVVLPRRRGAVEVVGDGVAVLAPEKTDLVVDLAELGALVDQRLLGPDRRLDLLQLLAGYRDRLLRRIRARLGSGHRLEHVVIGRTGLDGLVEVLRLGRRRDLLVVGPRLLAAQHLVARCAGDRRPAQADGALGLDKERRHPLRGVDRRRRAGEQQRERRRQDHHNSRHTTCHARLLHG